MTYVAVNFEIDIMMAFDEPIVLNLSETVTESSRGITPESSIVQLDIDSTGLVDWVSRVTQKRQIGNGVTRISGVARADCDDVSYSSCTIVPLTYNNNLGQFATTTVEDDENELPIGEDSTSSVFDLEALTGAVKQVFAVVSRVVNESDVFKNHQSKSEILKELKTLQTNAREVIGLVSNNGVQHEDAEETGVLMLSILRSVQNNLILIRNMDKKLWEDEAVLDAILLYDELAKQTN